MIGILPVFLTIVPAKLNPYQMCSSRMLCTKRVMKALGTFQQRGENHTTWTIIYFHTTLKSTCSSFLLGTKPPTMLSLTFNYGPQDE